MTATQSLKIYEILSLHFKNNEDAKEIVQSIEKVIDEKVEDKTILFEKIVTKDIENLRQEMYKTFATKQDLSDAKVDIIKWIVAMWIAQMAAIVFLIIRK
jgi:hypothetical protein